MIRLLAAVFAVGVYVAPVLVLPAPAIAVVGLPPLLLVAMGIAGGWRRPVTAGACLFVAHYAMALWVSGRSVDVLGAAAFGLALVLLLEAVDLGCRTRGATIGAAVVRAQITRWSILAVVTLASAVLTTTLAIPLASALPAASAPLLAAAGALAVVLLLAAVIVRAGRTRPDAPDRIVLTTRIDG
jgi:hypothetical protein